MYLNASDFPFIADLEASWEVIRDEMLNLPKRTFTPWPEEFLYESGWNVFGLHAYGQKLQGNCALCPRTTEIIERIPHLTTAGFSWLEPGTHIKPHVGYSKAVYRSHLGLVVPKDCWLRVGLEKKTWQEGKVLVFDDTTEHEVRNDSASQRVVLLIDFKRADADFDMVNRDRAMVLGKLLRMKKQMALSS
jgi:ornithine lipid ester-linked acyl 2-hydroxylase